MMAAPDVRLNHAVEGSGTRSLVLLHELGGTLRSFDHLAPLLAGDFRILRYDQRGCGSSATPRGPYPFDEHVRDLEQLLNTADLKPPLLMAGFAAGSAIAVAFALRHPNEVAALALCAPALSVDASRRIYLAERSALVAREGMGAVVEDTLARSYPEQFRKADPARFEIYRRHFLANDPIGYGYLNMAFADVALTESAGALDLPCLLVAGERDPLRPPDQSTSSPRASGARSWPSSTPAISWRCTCPTNLRADCRRSFSRCDQIATKGFFQRPALRPAISQ